MSPCLTKNNDFSFTFTHFINEEVYRHGNNIVWSKQRRRPDLQPLKGRFDQDSTIALSVRSIVQLYITYCLNICREENTSRKDRQILGIIVFKGLLGK